MNIPLIGDGLDEKESDLFPPCRLFLRNASADAAAAETLEGKCGDTAEFSFDDETGTLTIFGTGTVTLKDTAIYDLRASIRSIAIGDGVTGIDEDAFSGCTELTEISIPDSVTEIGTGAFSAAAKLPISSCRPS